MKKRIAAAAIASIISISIFASSPQWKRVNHVGSTIFTAIVNVDGKPVPATAFVGAFKDNECRMVAPIIMSNDTAYVSSVIHGDVPEDIEFRLWLSPEKEKTCKKTMRSNPGESILMYKLDF